MRLGDWDIRAIEAERFRLDGGAMHGVVPRALWAPLAPPDADNRAQYTTRCLLLEGHGRRILVETGNGDKWSAREMRTFAIEPGAGIARRLRDAGVEPDSVDTVVLTHLHFDHVGGAVWRDESGAPRPTFARARHVAQRQEISDAFHPNERTRASYRAENLDPLAAAGLLHAVDGETEIAPGLRVVPTPGHTAGHQSVLVEGEGRARLLFFGDVVPTSVHLKLPWIMAYDLAPLETLETKRRLIERAAREGWIVVWGHDVERAAARVRLDERGNGVAFEPVAL